MYEPNLLQQFPYERLLERLNRLEPSSTALWGKMDVAQMMAHVTANLENAMGTQKRTWTLMGRLFGRTVKRDFFTNGIAKNTPTLPRFLITDARQFQTELERLQVQLKQFVQAGNAGMTTQPHDFLGRMTPNEWAHLQYLHVDHHLRQFGV
jgi:Protein of unknown function (DUF1569)